MQNIALYQLSGEPAGAGDDYRQDQRQRGPEATMLMPLPMIILASQLTTMVADTMPRFDIVRSCRADTNSSVEMDRCVDEEKEARDRLQPQWLVFDRADRLTCTAETNLDSTPSYVELLTCLETARGSKKPRAR
jgi:hypothetical protein